jgi:succinoglycan biosynthesis protein ExoO
METRCADGAAGISSARVARGAGRDVSATDGVRTPDVSFLVAAFNVGPYVGAAVRSALQQTGVDVEVIVVDDASTDNTAEVLAELADGEPRLKIISRSKTGGPSQARNEAIALARGQWLAVLDGDDLIYPDRSRRLIDLAAATQSAVVADNFERFRQEDEPALSTMIEKGAQPYSFLVDEATFIDANIPFARAKFTLGAIKPMFRRDFLRAADISYRNDLPIGEDYYILLECLQAGGRFVVTSDSLYRYRLRDGSQSWRLKEEHVVRLQRAHADVARSCCGETEVDAALHRFGAALGNVRVFTHVVEEAKGGRAGRALWRAVTTPRIWRFVARFGAQGVARRLGLIS